MTKYLGVDFGLKRVGLAQSEGELASPWKVIEGKNLADLVEKLRIDAIGFDQLIIGLPEGKTGQVILKVIKQLKDFGLNVISTDETLSSQNATKLMVKLNKSKKKRKINDAHSAAIILQDYLDQ